MYAIEKNLEILLEFRTQASDMWLKQVVLVISSYSSHSIASSGVYKALNARQPSPELMLLARREVQSG